MTHPGDVSPGPPLGIGRRRRGASWPLLLVSRRARRGLDAAGDLGNAIASLRRRLRAHDIGLPPALEDMIDDLGDRPTGGADLHLLQGGSS